MVTRRRANSKMHALALQGGVRLGALVISGKLISGGDLNPLLMARKDHLQCTTAFTTFPLIKLLFMITPEPEVVGARDLGVRFRRRSASSTS